MKRSARLVLVLVAVAALLSATGCSKLKARDQLNKGVKAYKNAEYDKAIDYFKRAVEYDDKLKLAKLYLAIAYADQVVEAADTPENNKAAQQAIAGFESLLQDDPNNILALKHLASLYMKLKRFDDSRKYYRKAIDADPNDPEAYYSVGVIDWSFVYKDIGERKGKVGLKIEDQLKSKQVCEEIKTVDGPRIDDGIKMLTTAMEKRADYDDAMTYVNLLYHRKADTECGDPQAYAEDIKTANAWVDKAMAARKKKADEAARKTSGGIVIEPPKGNK